MAIETIHSPLLEGAQGAVLYPPSAEVTEHAAAQLEEPGNTNTCEINPDQNPAIVTHDTLPAMDAEYISSLSPDERRLLAGQCAVLASERYTPGDVTWASRRAAAVSVAALLSQQDTAFHPGIGYAKKLRDAGRT